VIVAVGLILVLNKSEIFAIVIQSKIFVEKSGRLAQIFDPIRFISEKRM